MRRSSHLPGHDSMSISTVVRARASTELDEPDTERLVSSNQDDDAASQGESVAWSGQDILSGASPRALRITVRNPGDKLGVSLTEHPEGTCVHASEDRTKQGLIGKLASRIELVGEGRGMQGDAKDG